MDKKQFAQVKQLFALVCDLPAAQQLPVLQSHSDDLAVINEVLALVNQGALQTTRFGQPVAGALAAIAHAPLQPGDVLGAWTLSDEIGQGGMGKVYLAARSDGHFEQLAAIKLLGGIASKRALEYLVRERQILASLSHPNIARLFDGGTTSSGQPYLVMEYIEGLPIDVYCRQHKLSRPAILKLFMVVCAAVAFAHQRLVVHCDLKPSNILVNAEGRPILLDFGVSRLLNAASTDTADTATAGDAPIDAAQGQTLTAAAFTPRYASPEQKAHEVIGTGSDVYSLGLMLCELMGVPLSSALSPEFMLISHLLDSDLTAIIVCATAFEPSNRYSGANALANDLQRFLDHQPVSARPHTAPYVAGRLLRRQWPLALATIVLVVTVTAFSWRAVIERDKALEAEKAAREVKDYIISVFQGADPEVSGQRDLMVSALLDKGRDELPLRLKDQPKTRVEMVGILGGIYQKIGKREQAIKMFDEALALEKTHNRPLVYADLLYKKAYTVYDSEDYARAEPILREVLKLRESVEPESAALVDPLRFLGTTLSYSGKDKAARVYLDRAGSLASRYFGENSVEAAQVHMDVGRHHAYSDGRMAESEWHARAAVHILEEKLGRDHFLTVDALEILTVSLRFTKKFDEGIPLAREVSEKRAKFYGEMSNKNIFGLYSYASMLSRSGRRLEAAALFERCIVIQEKLDGTRNLALAEPLSQLAILKADMGAYDAAYDHATETIAIKQKHNAVTTEGEVYAKFIAGRALRALGRIAEALAMTSSALTQRQQANARPSFIAASTLELAAVYRTKKKYDQAEKLLASLDGHASAKSPEGGGRIVAERARLVQANGKFAEAMELFIEAEAMFVKGYGEQHPDSWLPKIDRAELLVKLGRRDEARVLARAIAANVKEAIDPQGHIARRLAKLQA